MSFLAFTKDATKAFLGKFWGGKVKDENGTLKDTGVQEFVEELVARLSAQQPIVLDKPLEFLNKTNGPGIIMYNDGPVRDWIGYRVQDAAGNVADLGIGLGSSGINANSLIPDPRFAIIPDDAHRYHSDLGGNAAGDKEHPKAIEANNGLLAPLGLIGNFQVPLWLVNLNKQPQFQADDCHPRYRADWFGQPIYFPTYVPQSEILYGTADSEITKGNMGNVSVGADTYADVANPFFLCIEANDKVAIACIGGGYKVIATEEKPLFALGDTEECIEKGASGDVLLDVGGTVTASSPFDTVASGVRVAVSRVDKCSEWVITARECEPPGTC